MLAERGQRGARFTRQQQTKHTHEVGPWMGTLRGAPGRASGNGSGQFGMRIG